MAAVLENQEPEQQKDIDFRKMFTNGINSKTVMVARMYVIFLSATMCRIREVTYIKVKLMVILAGYL